MNVTIKSALAVAALALGASAAQAAIPAGNIVFNEWNNATNAQGYTWDTGLAAASFTGNTSFSVTLTNAAAIAAFNSNSANVQWNVAGAAGANYFTTGTTNNVLNYGSNIGEGNFEQSSAVSAAGTIYSSLTTNTASLSSAYWAASFSQGNGSLADLTDKIGGGASSSMNFLVLDTNATPTLFSGTWTLQFLNAAGGLATTGTAVSAVLAWSPTAVPLPAAVWLLGSGLAGLAGIGRRRKLTVA
jgi:hypothetical protein